MEFKENLLIFVSKAKKVMAVLDFIRNENIDVLTILTYKRGFSRDCSSQAILKGAS
jgi:hypothetical protein